MTPSWPSCGLRPPPNKAIRSPERGKGRTGRLSTDSTKKGVITDPVNKSKRVHLTVEGVAKSKALFEKLHKNPKKTTLCFPNDLLLCRIELVEAKPPSSRLPFTLNSDCPFLPCKRTVT